MLDQQSKVLLDRDYILRYLTAEAPWCESHGAQNDFLGMGCLYYALCYVCRARVAVCLGSGGGFVPRLMRQAQRDLRIEHKARTILVDANRPEGGWGAPAWLPEDSLFRREFGDIEVVLSTTCEAADRVFAAQRLSIDYLHIDADHSFESCLKDFETYRQFLRPGSVVTMHDTRLNGAGVRSVIDYLRTRRDCELIDFPDLGTGTALVRIHEGSGAVKPPRRSPSMQIGVSKRSHAPDIPPPRIGWKYLESEAFSTRNVLAAHFLRPCQFIIEIGGGRTSILPFLTSKPQALISIDPQGRDEELEEGEYRVLQLRARFQDIDWTIPKGCPYGLVMLGMELQDMSQSDYVQLYNLIDQAIVTVIEFPGSWEPSRSQFERIRTETHTRLRFQGKFDLSGNDFGNLANSWGPRTDREVYVLEPSCLAPAG